MCKKQAERDAAAVFFLFSKPNIFQFFARHLQLFCIVFQLKNYRKNLAATSKAGVREKCLFGKGFYRVCSVFNGSGRNNSLGHGVYGGELFCFVNRRNTAKF
jgi:hypothetical protein